MREAKLAFGSVDVQIHGVPVGHDHAARIVTQQGAGRVTITAGGDLEQRRVNGRGDRQPPRIAGLPPRRLIRAAHRGLVEMLKDPHVRVLQRRRRLFTSASTDAALTWIPQRSSSSLPVSRRDTRAAVNVEAAAATVGPNAPSGTPAGSGASVLWPHPQRVRIGRCSHTSTTTVTSLT